MSTADRNAKWFVRTTEILCAVLLVAAFLSIQAFIGGTRLLFAFPAFGLIALVGLLSLFSWRTARPAADRICLWSTIIFLGYVELRAVLSPAIYLARFDIYPVLAGLIVYFVTANVLTSPRVRMSILTCLLAAALAHVFVGMMQFSLANNFMPISFLQRFDYGRRASGFYVCPNHLAGLLEVLGVFGVSFVCWSRWPVWAKLLIGYATAVCYVGIVLTGSRGGYLSVIASLAVFAILSLLILRASGKSLLTRIGVPAVLAAAFLIIATSGLIHKSGLLNSRSILDNKNARLEFWHAAVEQWKLAPLFGTGSRTYQFYGRKFRSDDVQYDPVYVHNDYLQLLCDYGIIGALTCAIFLIAHLRRGWLDARRLGPRRVQSSHRLTSNRMALHVGALAAASAYIVHSVFDFNLHIPANILLMAFAFGILANAGAARETVQRSPGPWSIWPAILGLVLAIQIGRLTPGEYYGERARAAVRDYRWLSGINLASTGLLYEKQNPNLYYSLARARILGGEAQHSDLSRNSFFEAALAPLERGYELVPWDETFPTELAFTFDAMDRFPEAEWMFYEARKLDPRSASLKIYYETHLERWRKFGVVSPEPPKS